MIGIIDYGMGNLGSVRKALQYLGAESRISDDPAFLRKADALILPGVGAMGQAMTNMTERGLGRVVKTAVDNGVPFLGVCLGMQLLFEDSEEGGAKGLGILPGHVRLIPPGPGLKIPHMGWNTIELRGREASGDQLLRPDESVYFVHSYHAVPDDPSIVTAVTGHGIGLTAAVGTGNVDAFQVSSGEERRPGHRDPAALAEEDRGRFMIIYPAIDLLGGKCVRLRQGDYGDVKQYADDPLAVARSFKEAGAEWIHVVDLDAAKTGMPVNRPVIAEIAAKTGLKVQTGGGIRSMESVGGTAGSRPVPPGAGYGGGPGSGLCGRSAETLRRPHRHRHRCPERGSRHGPGGRKAAAGRPWTSPCT